MLRALAQLLPVVALLPLVACQDAGPLREDAVPSAAHPSVGAIHNEFLDLLYEEIESGRHSNRWGAVVVAADAVADRYGAERLNERQILEAVELGDRLARRDPSELVASLLSAEELRWWERFASEATHADAHAIRESHVERFGAPAPEGRLADFLDVAVHSAEFWSERYGEEELRFFDPGTGTSSKGWGSWGRKLLRFSTAVVVDGFAGSAASGGVGPVGGAIVGGLASYGADCLLYGCD